MRACCEDILTADECKKAMTSMKKYSSPGSDGLTTSWYRTLWPKIEHILVKCYNDANDLSSLCVSHARQDKLTLDGTPDLTLGFAVCL